MSSIMEPPVVQLDLTSQAFKQNPFPNLARLRKCGPLVRLRLPFFGKVWVATTYEAVNDLLRDHHQFVQNPVRAGNRWMGALLRWLPRSLKPIATNMLLRDPPDHRRLRVLVDQAFQRQSVEDLRPRLEALADQALDHLAEEATRAPGGVDLLTHFARPFPLAVICELLGLPPEDRQTFTRWAMGLTTASSLLGILKGLFGVGKMMNYVRMELQRQTREPHGGLIAALLKAEEAGDRLTEDELVAMVLLLLVAGHETTLHMIATGVLTLFDHPQQLAELTSDWTLADSTAQELLRYVSFAQITKPRYAWADTEFCGQHIRRGQILVACLASANSDPSVFENPDQFNIHRHPNRHVAFGAGIHVCLGARLARAEIAIALQRLFSRFPNIQLAVPRSQIMFASRFGSRGLLGLPPVKW